MFDIHMRETTTQDGRMPAPDEGPQDDSVVTLRCSDGERFMQHSRLLALAQQAPILKVRRHL